jgi:hypothetical protein
LVATAAAELLEANDDKERQAAVDKYNAKLLKIVDRLTSSGVIAASDMQDFAAASQKLDSQRNELVKEIGSQALVNLEYALIRPPAVTQDSATAPKSIFQPSAWSARGRWDRVTLR